MNYETVVAVYDTPAHAEAAAKALKAGGFAAADISIFDEERLKAGKAAIAKGVKEAGFWHRLFGDDVHEHEAVVYGQTIDRGGVVVSARVIDSEVAHAIAILDLHRPVDVHDRAVTSGVAPLAHVDAVEKKLEAVPLAAKQTVAVSPKLAQAHDEVLRLAEEQLQVGKEMVETGRTRVRRFVTEREASADVTLHEEHAELLRRAVTDPKFVGTIDWADQEIEVVETAEHALVNKTARVVEEVSLKKIGTDHVETVKEKLRRQEVEIQRVGAVGRNLTPEQRNQVASEFKRFGADLQLSDQQKSKLQDFLSEARGKVAQYQQANPNATRTDIVKQVGANRDELRQRLTDFLSPDQLKKWDAEVGKAKEFFGQQMG